MKKMVTIDGNEAAAYIAHKTNEVIAIYPITPSSTMGELADEWSVQGRKNIWGTIPKVEEMQSEGGAAGAVHGALQTGALATTFTASQGLLLMLPNAHKISGELNPTVFHVTARSLASHALSIFGDHSDIMDLRTSGFAMLGAGSVQEVMDMALIAQASTLKSRIPFIHFFDGFRSSHEIQKIEQISEEQIRAMIDDEDVMAHRQRALTPDRPVIRGTAQNPDHFFQAREKVNTYYDKTPAIVQEMMDRFYKVVGRRYNLFDYVGDPEAERVIVLMASGTEAVQETVEYLRKQGEKVGVVKVHLYRPFSVEAFFKALPKTAEYIAVLDRTKEAGSIGEPLYMDVVNAMYEGKKKGINHCMRTVIGGRYGLSSKEFTPAMVKGVFDELKKENPKRQFTVGIHDDVTHLSLEYDKNFSTEGDDVFRGIFYGLGSDGTVGANKNSIKIIGDYTDNYAQGYFVYDSKKAGAVTVSHLRFGKNPIHSTYIVDKANFIACHQWEFINKYDMLKDAIPGATFLLNSQYGPEEVWNHLPKEVQKSIIEKQIKFYVIDAYKVASDNNMGIRINTIMQTCFFAISNILPKEKALELIKEYITKSYGKKGEQIVKMNHLAVDNSVANLHQVDYPKEVTATFSRPPIFENAPEYVQNVLGRIMQREGDELPVSAFPDDGTFPTGTTQYEKRNIALEIPIWDKDACIQCGKCSFVCPHAAIRTKIFKADSLNDAPASFETVDYKSKEYPGCKFRVQVAPEDCTGCGCCVSLCPVKNKEDNTRKAINMKPVQDHRETEKVNYDYFLAQKDVDRSNVRLDTVKGSQLLRPLFEYSGACAGCGETAYIKLMTQLFGDRAVIANATGCSSIYGGNLPTTPYCKNADGRGPAWSNSLFEDNAEFGLGYRLTLDKHNEFACELLQILAPQIGEDLVTAILTADQSTEKGIQEQRERVEILKQKLAPMTTMEAKHLHSLADVLVKKSVWILGGDGWAYDIGYGGLDHVLASGHNVNVLVLDTEVYSNTGGQMSKSTPMGAVAKFAMGGKPRPKKDLALMALSYGFVYVAKIAMGYNDQHCVRAFLEAEAYNGPSLIIAYSHCIAHGINMVNGFEQQKKAVLSGCFPTLRFNPEKIEIGEPPLTLDCKEPSIPLEDYIYNENRYKMLQKSNPEAAKELLERAKDNVKSRWNLYKQIAEMTW
ncbi:MAG: pyruvate:ferredoxin (flavodoxin) oxidoreductase [Planctomycetes bacterium]|jgi:pyruvate-ferredoxin/flavodoxin oxidoreductase|nr:pyruvate:ferredoxin (flavodoxin) oxidoreductase [Planctomycetota bacterium]